MNNPLILVLLLRAITIPQFFQFIPNITVLKSQAPFTDSSFKLQTTFSLIEKAVQFAIGFGLIFGRRGLAKILKEFNGHQS